MATITHDDAVGSMRTRVTRVTCETSLPDSAESAESAESAAATFFSFSQSGPVWLAGHAAVRRILY